MPRVGCVIRFVHRIAVAVQGRFSVAMVVSLRPRHSIRVLIDKFTVVCRGNSPGY
jgi:hypothetical protein